MLLSASRRRTTRLIDWPRPTYLASRGLRRLRQLRRLGRWIREPQAFADSEIASAHSHPHLHHRSVVSLRRCGSDPRLEAGKIRNVALAAVALNDRRLEPGSIFSFWRAVGRPSAAAGFALGAEVRGGCIVPTVGGGLCVASNALFAAAAELGWIVHERWGHTITTDPESVRPDATVAWPDIDLRLEPAGDVVLSTVATSDEFRLSVWGREPASQSCNLEVVPLASSEPEVFVTELVRHLPGGKSETLGQNRKRLSAPPSAARNCFTCNEHGCHARPKNLHIA